MVRYSETYADTDNMLPIEELDSCQQEIIALLHELEKRGWDGRSGL